MMDRNVIIIANNNFDLFFTKFYHCSSDYTTNCARCWSLCRLVGGWRLSPPYVALGVALIMWPHRLWLSHVAGVQMIMLAVLRLFTIFRYGGSRGKGDELLPQHDDSFEKWVFVFWNIHIYIYMYALIE